MTKTKKSETQEKLDADSKNVPELHAEWLRCLEEAAIAHMELREARQDLRKSMDAWAERQVSGPLTGDGYIRTNHKLLKSHQLCKILAEAARVARDAQTKAWEAQGLPASRQPATDTDDEAELVA